MWWRGSWQGIGGSGATRQELRFYPSAMLRLVPLPIASRWGGKIYASSYRLNPAGRRPTFFPDSFLSSASSAPFKTLSE